MFQIILFVLLIFILLCIWDWLATRIVKGPMGKIFGHICIVLVLWLWFKPYLDHSTRDEKIPIPRSHPAYEFYQIASRGPTTSEVCLSFGGKEIAPVDYTEIEHLAQGISRIRENSTGKQFLAISFGEGHIIVTLNHCCWKYESIENWENASGRPRE